MVLIVMISTTPVFFAKDIDTALYETMRDDIKEAMGTKLEVTNELRPLGLLFDKMTPSKETGQIHAIIISVPENQMSHPLLVPVCPDVPPVTDHSITALAKLSKTVVNKFGANDKQIKGVAVDREYVRKGLKDKLIEELDIPGLNTDDKDSWITLVWDPAHELELAVKDVRKDNIFEWLEQYIKQVNEATELLIIGKGLQQSKAAAEELGENL